MKTLKQYVDDNFDSNTAAAARQCVRASTGKNLAQNNMWLLMSDENYVVIDIDGTPTVFKKMAEFKNKYKKSIDS